MRWRRGRPPITRPAVIFGVMGRSCLISRHAAPASKEIRTKIYGANCRRALQLTTVPVIVGPIMFLRTPTIYYGRFYRGSGSPCTWGWMDILLWQLNSMGIQFRSRNEVNTNGDKIRRHDGNSIFLFHFQISTLLRSELTRIVIFE